MADQRPSVGRIVHYVSYGTPGGEFGQECRAAVVAAVATRDRLALVIFNPTGLFFNEAVAYASEVAGSEPYGVLVPHLVGGTWHWPERVE